MIKLLIAKEVATLLGVSIRKLEQMIAQGDFPTYVKFGRIRKWRADEIQNWVEDKFENAKVIATKREIKNI